MSLHEYMETINNEFTTLENRVRFLVHHWGEDGKYKEVILQNILRNILPKEFSIYSGFVIKSSNRNEHSQSKQIDLIVYDNHFPIYFKEGDFVIVPPEGVVGIIEVKTNLSKINGKIFNKVIKTCNENGKFIYDGKKDDRKLFNGLFSYEGSLDTNKQTKIKQIALEYGGNESKSWLLNHISVNKNDFIKYWSGSDLFYSRYNITNLSFVYFITNLIEYISDNAFGNQDVLWYPTDKEESKICDF